MTIDDPPFGVAGDRAVSEVLGYVLVFTLIMSSVTLVSVGIINSLEQRSNVESVDNAQAAFDVLADNVEDVYARGAPSRATEISVGSGSFLTGDNVTVEVRLVNDGGNDWPAATTCPSLTCWKSWRYRPLLYRSEEGATIAYELGAIYRISSNAAAPDSVANAEDRASARNRDPPFVVRGDSTDERLLVPIVHTNASTQRQISSTTVLIRTGTEATSLAAVKEQDTSGTYEELKIRLTGTPRYLEWAQYFESVDGFSCTTDDSLNRVACTYNKGGLTDSIEVVSIVAHEIPVSLEE